MATIGSTPYLGGWFVTFGGQTTSWNPKPGFAVGGALARDGIVYAWGPFRAMDDHPRHNVAAIDASAGNATGWDAGVNTTRMVDGMAPCGSFLCLFGDFYVVRRLAQRAFAVIGTSGPSAGPRITHYQFSDPTVVPIMAQTTKVHTP